MEISFDTAQRFDPKKASRMSKDEKGLIAKKVKLETLSLTPGKEKEELSKAILHCVWSPVIYKSNLTRKKEDFQFSDFLVVEFDSHDQSNPQPSNIIEIINERLNKHDVWGIVGTTYSHTKNAPALRIIMACERITSTSIYEFNQTRRAQEIFENLKYDQSTLDGRLWFPCAEIVGKSTSNKILPLIEPTVEEQKKIELSTRERVYDDIDGYGAKIAIESVAKADPAILAELWEPNNDKRIEWIRFLSSCRVSDLTWEEVLPVVIAVGRETTKEKQNEYESFCQKSGDKMVTRGTLHYYAKQVNPEYYTVQMNEKLSKIKENTLQIRTQEFDSIDEEFKGEPASFEATQSHCNFVPLGYTQSNGGKVFYYFFLKSINRWVTFTTTELHKQSTLDELEVFKYWLSNYFTQDPKTGRRKVNIPAAVEDLTSACIEKGIFHENIIRYTGYYDNCVHLGNRLYYKKEIRGLGCPPDPRFIYAETDTECEWAAVESDKETLFKKMKELKENWLQLPLVNDDALWLLGWMLYAPLHNLTKFRQHVWFVGGTDSGKSYFIDTYGSKLLGSWLLVLSAGNPSIAGFIQRINEKRVPTWIDEAEFKVDKTGELLSGVLSLLRDATEYARDISRGTLNGRPITYNTQVPYILTSERYLISDRADQNRTLMLEMNGHLSDSDWKKVDGKILSILNEIAPNIRRYLFDNFDQIKVRYQEISAFTSTTTRVSRGLAWILATLSIVDSDYKPEEYRSIYLKRIQGCSDNQMSDLSVDSLQNLFMLRVPITITIRAKTSRFDPTLGELIGWYSQNLSIDSPIHDTVRLALRQYGIIIKANELRIARRHPFLSKALTKSYDALLKRCKGSVVSKVPSYFGLPTRMNTINFSMVDLNLEDMKCTVLQESYIAYLTANAYGAKEPMQDLDQY